MSVRAPRLAAISLAFVLGMAGACSVDERTYPGPPADGMGGSGGGLQCAAGVACGCPGQAACPECDDSSTCEPSMRACVVAACVDHKCVLQSITDGTPIHAMDTPGDCHEVVCQAGVPTSVVDPADSPDPADDGENCTKVICTSDGGMEHFNESSGSPCTDGTCSSTGQCLHDNGVFCDAPSECKSSICADSVCCNDVCAVCTSCKILGTEGTCAPKAAYTDDSYCPLGTVCDGAGNCKLDLNKPCSSHDECVTGCCKSVCAPKNNCP